MCPHHRESKAEQTKRKGGKGKEKKKNSWRCRPEWDLNPHTPGPYRPTYLPLTKRPADFQTQLFECGEGAHRKASYH